MIKLKVCVFAIAALVSLIAGEDFGEGEMEQGATYTRSKKYSKIGEFNDNCKTNYDCRPFGYVCRDNKTCQCDFMYIPDSNKKTCVGGVNQRCTYDEHCIQGAYCMNQAVCKCKDSSPYELEDGLVCSGGKIRRIMTSVLVSTLMLALR